VLQDQSTECPRRAARIRTLGERIIEAASTRNVRVVLFSHGKVWRILFWDGRGTKHALAEILAKRFPQELGFRLPSKRRLWMSEDYRMDIFDAVALAPMPQQ
jgi:hypothetical protein